MASLLPSQVSLSTTELPRALPAKRPRGTTNEDADDENRRKDPKVSRACDSCKRKKVRCDGTLPCNNCTRRKLSCAYNVKYGRGRPPTPLSLTTVNEDQDRPVRSDQPREPSAWKQPATVAYEGSASQAYACASPETEINGQYSDPTSGLNFLHRAWKKLLIQKDEFASYDSNDAERNQLLTSAGDLPFHVDDNAPDSSIPDAATARQLQRFYFDECVVTYRMFHRGIVESWMEVFLKDRQNKPPVAQSLGNPKAAILLTIMAIATLRLGKVNGGMSAEEELVVLQRSDQLFCTGMKLTDAETGFPRLESAQARLIQVLYLLQTSRMNKAWYTLGSVFHITLSLGMHRKRDQKRNFPFTSRRQNYITSECFKRAFWAAYVIDKYLSVVLGRPRLYQDEDIDQDFPDNVNDEDVTPQGPAISNEPVDCYIDGLIFHAKYIYTLPAMATTTLLIHCRIAQIIGKVSREVYSVSNLSNHDRLAAAHRLARELREWRTSLPPHLGAVKPSTLMPSFRRQAIALQLAYYHALIHVNRPFLLSGPESENVIECILAAKASLELANRMAEDSMLFHSFWWTQYVIFCALAVVYVWEIQHTTRFTDEMDNQSLGEIFDLAERCRGHLKRASTGLLRNQRYSIILDELRSEARRCQHLKRNLSNPYQSGLHDSDGNIGTDTGVPFSQDPGIFGSDHESMLHKGTTLNMQDSFLFSDWQTLDSSVCIAFILLTLALKC